MVRRDEEYSEGEDGRNVSKRGGSDGRSTVGTVETRSQTVHLPPLCWGPSATKETADGGLGSTAVKSAKPPRHNPHTHTLLSHTKWVAAPSGSTFQQWDRYGGVSSPGLCCVSEQRTVGERDGCPRYLFSCWRDQWWSNIPSCEATVNCSVPACFQRLAILSQTPKILIHRNNKNVVLTIGLHILSSWWGNLGFFNVIISSLSTKIHRIKIILKAEKSNNYIIMFSLV